MKMIKSRTSKKGKLLASRPQQLTTQARKKGLDYDAFSGFARGAGVGRGKYVMVGSTKEYNPESADKGYGRRVEVLKITGKDSPRSVSAYHRKSSVGNKIDAFTQNLLGPGGKKVK